MDTNRDSYINEHFDQLISAFTKIELDERLADVPYHGYTGLSMQLLDAASEANGKNDELHFTALRLLHEICAVRLNLERPNNPFDDSFTDTEIKFFAEIAKLICNPFLKGRLADRVWNSRRYRNIEYARIAIDSYMNTPLDADTWFNGGWMCWHRSIKLCLLIGKGAENRMSQIKCLILATLNESTTERKFYAENLSHALKETDVSGEDSANIATKLESMAQKFDVAGNFHASGGYNKAASYWFERSKMADKVVDMKVGEAEAFEKEAMTKVSSDNPSHAVAVSGLKNAAKVLYEIPKDHRARHNIDKKIRDLELRISQYGHIALDEMATYKTPGIDVSDYARQARNCVGSKSVSEALVKFVNLHHIEVDELKESAKESISLYPFRRIFPATMFESDGRVGGTTPGYSESASDEVKEAVVLAEMFQFHYVPRVSIVVNGMILPALLVVNNEHCLRETDFTNMVRRSPIVPSDRKELWGKALFQGFNYDFTTSVHLLAPQIEHVVRCHLKAVGVRTTFTDRDSGGKETENGLCRLMESPEVESIFGPDWAYEINTLFCGSSGWNLRNEIAHGLLSDQQCHSIELVYAWWFALKIILLSSSLASSATNTTKQ